MSVKDVPAGSFTLLSGGVERDGCCERDNIVCIQTIHDFGGHAMEQRKIAKHVNQLNQTAFNQSFHTMTQEQSTSEKFFFRFVDKNPLFTDNSKNAIREAILSPRKTRSEFKSFFDEDYDMMADFIISAHHPHRNK